MKQFKIILAVVACMLLVQPASAFAVKFRPGMVLKGQVGTVTFHKPGLLVRQADGFVLRFDDGDCHIDLMTLDVTGRGCVHVSVEKRSQGG